MAPPEATEHRFSLGHGELRPRTMKGETVFVNTLWALVPPIIAIVLALITKETFSSLFVGILVGALLLTGFDPIETITAIIDGEFGEGEDVATTGLIPAVADNAGIFIFLV